MNKPITLGQMIAVVRTRLRNQYPPGEVEGFIKIIFRQLLGYETVDILLHKDTELPDFIVTKTAKVVDQLCENRPIQYIFGKAWFHGHEFSVDSSTLIPRPETEELVENALKAIKDGDKVLDLCTGSGAIAVTVNLKSGATVTASDISDEALSLAKENAARLGATVEFIKSDLFENINDKVSVIITNPPYIKSGDIGGLQTEVKDYEPRIALDGGEDGLDFYRRIATDVKPRLFKGGVVFCEVGEGQAEEVAKLFGNEFSVEIFNDLQGVARIVKAVLL